MPAKQLKIDDLLVVARNFAHTELTQPSHDLFGATDGKAVGTYVEHELRSYIETQGYAATQGSSANGLDFPDLNIDLKVTSLRQPQSSCPFKSAKQKVYGLGYSLLIFVYNKIDLQSEKKSWLDVKHLVYVDKSKTADFQLTKSILALLQSDANRDDLFALLSEKNLPLDELGLNELVDEIQVNPPNQGYLTISNALQWRLQYTRVIEKANQVDGIKSILLSQSV